TFLTALSTHLQSLRIYEDSIKNMISDPDIEELNLQGKNLTAFPSVINHLVKLRVLDLSNNSITAISDNIVNFVNLRQLSLHKNYLSHVPIIIDELANLNVLDLSSNQLSSVPATIVNLKNLQTLNLNSNQINIFPKPICHIPKIIKLEIADNNIHSLPMQISDLVSLNEILCENQLTNLSDRVEKLQEMQVLKLSKNCLESLPKELFTYPRVNLFVSYLLFNVDLVRRG
uniref:Leucine rich repeats and death domain containing 1 n=1 Tax=Callorhinchus milii TaxID=7868 RepID=A0A4W3JPE1_CALMI